MGSKKSKLESEVKELEKSGEEIGRNTTESLGEAQENAEILKSIEGLEEEDKAAIQEGIDQSREIASNIANSHLENADNVGENLDEKTSEANEYADAEASDADIASQSSGNYEGIGQSIVANLESSEAQFEAIGEESDSFNQEMKNNMNELISAMEEAW